MCVSGKHGYLFLLQKSLTHEWWLIGDSITKYIITECATWQFPNMGAEKKNESCNPVKPDNPKHTAMPPERHTTRWLTSSKNNNPDKKKLISRV